LRFKVQSSKIGIAQPAGPPYPASDRGDNKAMPVSIETRPELELTIFSATETVSVSEF